MIKQALCRCAGRAAGGHDIIHQDQSQSGDRVLTVKCLAQIALPLSAAQPLLAGSGPLTYQCWQHGALPVLPHQSGKVIPLIEAAAPSSSPMDRQRAHGIGIRPWQGRLCQ